MLRRRLVSGSLRQPVAEVVPRQCDPRIASGQVLATRFERNAFSSEFKLALSHSGSGQSEWNYGISESGFSDASISGRMNFALDQHSVLYFGANASTIVDTQIEEWIELLGIESTNLWVTVGLVWTY